MLYVASRIGMNSMFSLDAIIYISIFEDILVFFHRQKWGIETTISFIFLRYPAKRPWLIQTILVGLD